MPSSSTLARMQQAITLSLLVAGVAWSTWFWSASHVLALAGFAAIVLSYSLVLGLEFIALRFAGRLDPAPRPTWAELARAWAGETTAAPRVFCWRQPFRWRAVPDRLAAAPAGRRGVVFIHGFVCNRGFWNPWMRALQARGHCFAAVNLEPVFGSIDDYIPIIEEAVVRITQATGAPPILVCHSMGGLAARAWLRARNARERVHHVITIGSPHRGTWLASFSRLPNGMQMAQQGEWLRALEQAEREGSCAGFTCWYSNCDNIVFPASTATLPGADNRLVRGVAHVQLAFRPEVMAASLELITSG
jgi:predicted alpha/beta hydrolase family esterase